MSNFTTEYVLSVTKEHAKKRVYNSMTKTLERLSAEPEITTEAIQALHELDKLARHIDDFGRS